MCVLQGVADTERVGHLHCTPGQGQARQWARHLQFLLCCAALRGAGSVSVPTSQSQCFLPVSQSFLRTRGLSRGISSGHHVCTSVFTAPHLALGQPCPQGADAWSPALQSQDWVSEGCLLIGVPGKDARGSVTTVSGHLHTQSWEEPVHQEVAVRFKAKTRDSNRRPEEVGSTALCTWEDPRASGPAGQVAGGRLPLSLWGKHLQGRRTRCRG